MNTNQDQKLSVQWLKAKGWTCAAAARRCGVSTVHVFHVVSGKRESRKLVSKLLSLPYRDWTPRERIRYTPQANND